MQIRYLQDSDYDILLNWWTFWRFGIPSKDFLPENGLGGIMISSDDGIPICAGFLYMTNSKVAWLEYIVSNPEYREKDRKLMLTCLIQELTEIAVKNGYKYVFTTVKHPSLIERYKESGYVVGTVGGTEMVYSVK